LDKIALDKILAVSGCVVGLILTIVFWVFLKDISLALISCICSCAFGSYIWVKQKCCSNETGYWSYQGLHLTYMGFILAAILVVIFREDPNVRPLAFFILVGAAVATLAVDITMLREDKPIIYFTLVKIILIGLVLQWSLFIIFPDSLYGTDPWYHRGLVEKMIASGSFSRWDYYMSAFFHVVSIGCMKLTGLDYKWATSLIIGGAYSIVIPYSMFLIGKWVHSYKVGLLSSLAIVMAGIYLFFGIELIPSGLALIFIIPTLFVALRYRHKKKIIIPLTILIGGIVLITNVLTTVFLGAMLFLFWASSVLYRWFKYPSPTPSKILLVVALIFMIGTLAWWTLGSGQINIFLRLIGQDIVAEYLGTTAPALYSQAGGFSEEMASSSSAYQEVLQVLDTYSQSIPVLSQFTKRLNIFLYLALGLPGICLLIARTNKPTPQKFIWGVSALVVLSTVFITAAISQYLFVSRGILFCQLLMAVPIGISLYWVGTSIRKPIVRSLVIGMLVFILATLTYISPAVNVDNRTVWPDNRARLTLTIDEITAIKYAKEEFNKPVGSDWLVNYYMYEIDNTTRGPKYKASREIAESLIMADYNLVSDHVILLREEVVNHTFLISEGLYKLDYNPKATLKDQGFKLAFTNDGATIWVKEENEIP